MRKFKYIIAILVAMPLLSNAQTLQDTFDYAEGYDVEQDGAGLVISSKLTPTTTGVFVNHDDRIGNVWIQDVVNGEETKFRAYNKQKVLRKAVDYDPESGNKSELFYDENGEFLESTITRNDTFFLKMKSPIDGNWIISAAPVANKRKQLYYFSIMSGKTVLLKIVAVDIENSIYQMRRFYENGKPKEQGNFIMPVVPDADPEKMLRGEIDDNKQGVWFFWSKNGKKSTRNFDE